MEAGGSADPSCEKDYTKKPGLQHKYDQTGLLLLTDVAAECRAAVGTDEIWRQPVLPHGLIPSIFTIFFIHKGKLRIFGIRLQK